MGAVVQIDVEVTAEWATQMSPGFLGTTVTQAFMLNWTKQQYVQANPSPPDQTDWPFELVLPVSPTIIDTIEQRRQGHSFTLIMDTTLLLVSSGEPAAARTPDVYNTMGPRRDQDRMIVTEYDWSIVLEQWGTGIAVPIYVPLPATEPDPDRVQLVEHLRTALKKISQRDYQGAVIEVRMSLEMLRSLSPADMPIPKDKTQRSVDQRTLVLVQDLFDLASATLHTDSAIKNYSPTRTDAVTLTAATASFTQQIFSRLDQT